MEDIKTVKISMYKSARYTYKCLFPYDFTYGESNWGLILFKNSKFLSEEEILNKEFYYQCKNIGIDLNKNNYFFIITTTVTAGLDMDSYLEEPIIFVNETNKLIVLRTPKSKILSIEVKDAVKEKDFPEVNITPDQWQKLIKLLLPKIENDVINRGLLESADAANRIFIEKLFYSIGWGRIEFK